MKVTFAPDWRGGGPYQKLLASHLAPLGIEVDFFSGYRRVLPLARGIQSHNTDLFHIHWPEAYWSTGDRLMERLCRWRYPLDLALAHFQRPLIYTAHNLWPHNTVVTSGVHRLVAATLDTADAVIVHSPGALDELARHFPHVREKCTAIPDGDISPPLGTPLSQAEARAQLGLDSRPFALMFGRIEPYKGTEEVIEWWKKNRPDARLVILGAADMPNYTSMIRSLSGANEDIQVHYRFAPDSELALWLSAANCTILNYTRIFTSGAATLARAWGLPILLPHRLTTVNLGEPTPQVIRFHSFEEDFGPALQRALATPSDYAGSASWRETISWPRIAAKTAAVYQHVLKNSTL